MQKKKASTTTEVIVTETKYLLSDISKFSTKCYYTRIFIPSFCIEELKKASDKFENPKDVAYLNLILKRLSTLNLKNNNQIDKLYKEPSIRVEDRSIDIVLFCLSLKKMGYNVTLLTGSQEVAYLANLQNCGIKIEFPQRYNY